MGGPYLKYSEHKAATHPNICSLSLRHYGTLRKCRKAGMVIGVLGEIEGFVEIAHAVVAIARRRGWTGCAPVSGIVVVAGR